MPFEAGEEADVQEGQTTSTRPVGHKGENRGSGKIP